AGFFVSLLANDDPDALQSESFTQTDGDGRFRLQTLGPGPYAVNAWMGSERASARSVSPGDELLLVLRDPLRVPVRLEPAGAYALGGAVRALRASDGVRLSNGGTEDGGERLFCDVPAEPFRVEVRAGGYA